MLNERITKPYYEIGGLIPEPIVDEKNKGLHKIFNVGIGTYLTPELRADIGYSKYDPHKSSAIFNVTVESGSGSGSNTGQSGSIITNYKVSSQTILLNLYYDFIQSPKMTPYITAGVGFSRNHSLHSILKIEVDGVTGALGGISSCHSDSLAFAAGAGISFKISKDIDLDVSYRYSDLGKIQTGNMISLFDQTELIPPKKGRLTNHALMGGLRFSF